MLWDDHSCLERHAKKLKLALCKKLYMGLLAQVKELNRELKEFANESLILETSRAKRRHRAQGTNFTLIRRHASSLYDLLVTRRLWKCRCWKQHMVSLRLEPRVRNNSDFVFLMIHALTLKV